MGTGGAAVGGAEGESSPERKKQENIPLECELPASQLYVLHNDQF